MKKSIVLIALMLFASVSGFAQQTYTVKVVVKGLMEKSGKIYAAITKDSQDFPAVTGFKTASVEVKADGEIILNLEGIPAGRYAIFLFQDMNGNQKLDMNGQMPAEPFGFSNLSTLMGPPSFDECAFEVNENKVIEIGLFSL